MNNYQFHYKNYILRTTFVVLVLIVSNLQIIGQENKLSNYFSIASYGRIGADWSFEQNGSIGRRLNLNNMGSIGGRLEEQDYLELMPAFHFKPIKTNDSTIISAQLRFAFYSQSLSFFGNSTSNSLGGLTLGIPEMFVEAKNIGGKPLNIWIGARKYVDYDVHIADHFYFNDHTGQGFGIEYKKTRFTTLFVSSTDTTSTLPPYFYLNFKSGTPSATLRQRYVFILEHDLHISNNQNITLLGEYHYMPNYYDNSETITDSIDIILDYKSDYGLVMGMRLDSKLDAFMQGASNKLAIRFGNRIANGGDGGLSFTWLTYGAPDLDKKNYNGAYSLSIVDDFLIKTTKNNDLNLYVIYTHSKGAAKTDSTANTYFGREVCNKKTDFTVGMRDSYYITDMFHLISEIHYSQRQDGLIPTYSMLKFSLAPTLVPTGSRDYWARPHLRLVTSVARYNDSAMDNLYSPYLSLTGKKRWGYYFGIKAEWWI